MKGTTSRQRRIASIWRPQSPRNESIHRRKSHPPGFRNHPVLSWCCSCRPATRTSLPPARNCSLLTVGMSPVPKARTPLPRTALTVCSIKLNIATTHIQKKQRENLGKAGRKPGSGSLLCNAALEVDLRLKALRAHGYRKKIT